MKIIDRIEKAISAVHGNRIVMHIPPFDSDVDVVLSDCRMLIEEQQKRIDELETRINLLIQKWEKDAEYADQIASEDSVQNTLNDCIEELRQVMKGGEE